jgi:hypothetical protein
MARIARRSLIETRNHLEDARKQQYFKEQEIKELIHLSFRSQKATTRLIKYLERCKGKPFGTPFGTPSEPFRNPFGTLSEPLRNPFGTFSAILRSS